MKTVHVQNDVIEIVSLTGDAFSMSEQFSLVDCQHSFIEEFKVTRAKIMVLNNPGSS